MESEDEAENVESILQRDEDNVATTMYSRDQVLAIISNFQATPSDYLIQAYCNICKIDEGPLYGRYKSRFNHIVFNNLKVITGHLLDEVFLSKIREIIREEIAAIPYVSCIFPHNQQSPPCPMFLQFFNPRRGIEHRLLGYVDTREFELDSILIQNGVTLEKIAGFCGDFSYRDPKFLNCQSNHFTFLSDQSERTIRYLPYSEGFISDLFDYLLTFLPDEFPMSLDVLGQTLVKITQRSPFVTRLVQEYRAWLDNNRQPHILLSNYAKFVLDNVAIINQYLRPFQNLSRTIQCPQSFETLLRTVLQRFLLFFMREIYVKVNEIKLSDNCAVMYYFQLVEIRNLFKSFEESHYIPPKALHCFNVDIEKLTQSRQLHPDHETKIDKLNKDMLSITKSCFTRAIAYLSPVIEGFSNFDYFSWVLLKNSSIDENQVHQTYHVIESQACTNCHTLREEVKQINSVLPRLPLVEMQDGIVAKWVAILQECPEVPLVTRLLQYLLSLPASFSLLDGYETDSSYEKARTVFRFNMAERSYEEVVANIEEFVGARMAQTKSIIKKYQIPELID